MTGVWWRCETASGFPESQIDEVEPLSLFPANLNDKRSEREICVFLLDNYILLGVVDYCVCAIVTLQRSLLQRACVFCSTELAHAAIGNAIPNVQIRSDTELIPHQ